MSYYKCLTSLFIGSFEPPHDMLCFDESAEQQWLLFLQKGFSFANVAPIVATDRLQAKDALHTCCLRTNQSHIRQRKVCALRLNLHQEEEQRQYKVSTIGFQKLLNTDYCAAPRAKLGDYNQGHNNHSFKTFWLREAAMNQSTTAEHFGFIN